MTVHHTKYIRNVVAARYTNPNTRFAKDFKEELQRTGKAARNIGAIHMRRGGININQYFQAKKVKGGYKYRWITSGHGWPGWDW